MSPLPEDLINVLKKYLFLERPKTDSPYLFIVIKGPNRGNPLTASAFRTIFRYHRKISGIHKANPHRFRHTFGANMARAGISLIALMKLMGHTHIQTTLQYVNLSVDDIKTEFNKVITKLQAGEFTDGAGIIH
jgi:integrase